MGELYGIEHEFDEIDRKSNQLIDEFQNHYSKVIAEFPEATDRKDEIFQSWVIQKIAGIHFAIEKLSENINNIIENKEKSTLQ